MLLNDMQSFEQRGASGDCLDEILLGDDPLELFVQHDSASPASPDSCCAGQACSDAWQSSHNDGAVADASEPATGSPCPGGNRAKTPECCSGDTSSRKVRRTKCCAALVDVLLLPFRRSTLYKAMHSHAEVDKDPHVRAAGSFCMHWRTESSLVQGAPSGVDL